MSWTVGGSAVQGVDVGDTQDTWFETTVIGPGTLTFYWKVSSEVNYDYLRLTYDGFNARSISGNVGWTFVSYPISVAGPHVMRWRYVKDTYTSSGSDTGWVDSIDYYTGSPTFTPTVSLTTTPTPTLTESATCTESPTATATGIPSATRTDSLTPSPTGTSSATRTETPTRTESASSTITRTSTGTRTITLTPSITPTFSVSPTVTPLLDEAVDRPGLGLTGSGAALPYLQSLNTNDGVDAMVSGALGHGQTSAATATVTGPIVIDWWWSVDSEADFDLFRFYVDGVEQARISGVVPWTRATYLLPAGAHSISWAYSKDISLSVGQDAAWLDQVIAAPPSPTPSHSPTPSPTFTASPTATLSFTSSPTYTTTPTTTPTPTITPTWTESPTSTVSPTALPTVAAPSQQFLAPNPAHVGDSVCLGFGGETVTTHWDLYNFIGERVGTLAAPAQVWPCYDTGSLAPGMYFVMVDATKPDGSVQKVQQRLAVTR
jgi:hypothetical protein